MSWQRVGTEAAYRRTEGEVDAVVILEGEIWKASVYFVGELVGKSEWDGRHIAFRNARAAMKRAVALRNPMAEAQKSERFEDEDDDDIM